MGKIAISSDHAGYELKEKLKNYLKEKFEIIDLGTDSSDSVDYPDFAKKMIDVFENDEVKKGIVICGTGIGISIAANRSKKVRAALCRTVFDAEMSRRHNNANVLALGGRVTSFSDAKNIAEVFFSTEFEGGRHKRRVEKFS